MSRLKQPIKIITLLTALLTSAISLLSLLNNSIYTDRANRITKYELMGQDIITAIVSLVFISIILLKNYNNIKIKIIWLGSLIYIFYIYAYFSFGVINSPFYLIYILLTGLSLFIFLFIIIELIRSNNFPSIKEKYPRKSISAFLILCILLVGTIEVKELITKTIIQTEIINPFSVFYVLDLGIIFPLIIIAAVLNIKKSPIGYLLSGISLFKIITILPAVIFNDVFHNIYQGYFLDLSFDIIALIITITGLCFIILYMRKIDATVSGTSHNSQ